MAVVPARPPRIVNHQAPMVRLNRVAAPYVGCLPRRVEYGALPQGSNQDPFPYDPNVDDLYPSYGEGYYGEGNYGE